MTVRRLLNELDSYELTEWMAYFQVENAEAGQSTDKAELQAQVAKQRKGRR